ncbi:MAG TPA: polysaccharide deacetylase family protein [Afifellaceae bacterium]|nr:polysaccharide deacetylase family protein [Afifellaceae bacterium]
MAKPARHRLIAAALRGLAASRLARMLVPPPDARGLVLTLHHVRPDPPAAFAPNAHLSVTPDFLSGFVDEARRNGLEFRSLDELLHTGRQEGGGRRIAVTLDDGFRDNAEHALPVFRRLGVPFTIFACPGFCDRDAELWWEALELIVRDNDEIAVDGFAPQGPLPAATPAEKQAAWRRLERLLVAELDEDEQRRAIRLLAERHGLDLAGLADRLVMAWDELRAIAAEPLCTIGAHTMTHPALARLPAERAIAEMRASADRIEAELGRRPWAVAFPYGTALAAGPREARLAAEAGFAASFTTRPGYVAAGAGTQGLPRVSLNGLFQDARLVQPLLEPGLWRLRDRLRRLGRGRVSARQGEAGPAAASS